MKNRILLKLSTILLAFGICMEVVASTSGPICSAEYQESLDPIRTKYSTATNETTVRAVTNLVNREGQELLKLERVGATWISRHADMRFDYQGDPRWPLVIFGESAAKVFGVELMSPDIMTIPMPGTISRNIEIVNERLNRAGHESIPVKFVADNLEARPLRGYLDYIRDSKIPFSTGGVHLVHDVSYHMASILVPPRYMKVAKKRVEFTTGFLDYIRADQSSPFKGQEKFAFKYVMDTLVRGLDDGLASTTPMMIRSKYGRSSEVELNGKKVSVMGDGPFNAEQFSRLVARSLVIGRLGYKYFRHDKLPEGEGVYYKFNYESKQSLSLQNLTLDIVGQLLFRHFKHEKLEYSEAQVREQVLKWMKDYVTDRKDDLHQIDLLAALSSSSGVKLSRESLHRLPPELAEYVFKEQLERAEQVFSILSE
ncbi:MAG: hypothetical protein AB8E15_04435 [Bdellovibrionales bacterium]